MTQPDITFRGVDPTIFRILAGETVTCRRCGRKLRTTAEAGIGPVCARREEADKVAHGD